VGQRVRVAIRRKLDKRDRQGREELWSRRRLFMTARSKDWYRAHASLETIEFAQANEKKRGNHLLFRRRDAAAGAAHAATPRDALLVTPHLLEKTRPTRDLSSPCRQCGQLPGSHIAGAHLAIWIRFR